MRVIIVTQRCCDARAHRRIGLWLWRQIPFSSFLARLTPANGISGNMQRIILPAPRSGPPFKRGFKDIAECLRGQSRGFSSHCQNFASRSDRRFLSFCARCHKHVFPDFFFFLNWPWPRSEGTEFMPVVHLFRLTKHKYCFFPGSQEKE